MIKKNKQQGAWYFVDPNGICHAFCSDEEPQVPGDWQKVSEPPKVPASVEDYQGAIQLTVDETARSKLFNDGVTMASYAASTVEPWAAQAQAFIAWRDKVWQYAYSELSKVQAGERAQPSVEDFLKELPKIVWP